MCRDIQLNIRIKNSVQFKITRSFLYVCIIQAYLKEHRKGRYTNLLSEGTLNQRLYEIDLEANEMLETIIPRLAAERGIDEDLKARDMLRWVAEMNNIKASAEEIVSREVIFV